ncbi:MAG: hypothetical protein JWM76_3195 [Pseudonocardiales bacterium]|nr:hypothetical protein [Pseudonocardiales bacterium]
MTQWENATDQVAEDADEVAHAHDEKNTGSDVGGPDAALGSGLAEGLSDDPTDANNHGGASADAASS